MLKTEDRGERPRHSPGPYTQFPIAFPLRSLHLIAKVASHYHVFGLRGMGSRRHTHASDFAASPRTEDEATHPKVEPGGAAESAGPAKSAVRAMTVFPHQLWTVCAPRRPPPGYWKQK